MKIVKISLMGCLLLFCYCATVKFYDDKNLKTETGIKFYSAKPYLLVEHMLKTSFNTANKNKAVTIYTLVKTSVIFLPDLLGPQYIKFRPGIGTSDLKINLNNSILTSYGLTTDTKIPETLSSIAGMITNLDSIGLKTNFIRDGIEKIVKNLVLNYSNLFLTQLRLLLNYKELD